MRQPSNSPVKRNDEFPMLEILAKEDFKKAKETIQEYKDIRNPQYRPSLERMEVTYNELLKNFQYVCSKRQRENISDKGRLSIIIEIYSDIISQFSRIVD